MAKKEETTLAERWDKTLKDYFGDDICIENIQQVGKVGTPDRLICLMGCHVSLEYKTEDGEPSKVQLYKLVKYRKAGGVAFVVTPSNFNKVFEYLKRIHNPRMGISIFE